MALLVAAGIFTPFAPVRTASAAIIVVMSLGDEPRDPAASAGDCLSTVGTCTLRAALATASTTQVDQIVFDPSIVPAGSTQTIVRTTPSQLTIDRSVVIRGPTNATLQIDGQDAGRVIELATGTGATAQISDLTIQNGTVAGFGGGVSVTASTTVVLERVILQDSVTTGASGGGLGVVLDGTAILRDVIVRNNQAASHGGGLFNQGVLDGERLQVSGNSAPFGGGISGDGQLRLVNGTIAQNTAATQGGGLLWYNAPSNEQRRIIQSTIARNSSPDGSNVNAIGGGAPGLLLERSIIAAPQGGGTNCSGGQLPSTGDNIVGSSGAFSLDTSCLSANVGLNDRLVNGITRLLDPAGLHANGGFSQTIALDPGNQPGVNLALDGVIHNACPEPETDQRNITRAVRGVCDVGAFEAAPPSLTLSSPPTTFTEGTPVVVDPNLMLTRGAGDLAQVWQARVEIVGNFQNNGEESSDTLTCPACGGTIPSISSEFDVFDEFFRLTLNGPADVGAFQAALRSVTFDTPGDAPATVPRTILFTVTGPSTVIAYREVQVQPQNDPLTLATNAGLSVAEGGTAAIGSSNLRVTDIDTPATGLVYAVTTPPTNGQLRVGSTTLGAGGTFTQSNIDAGQVTYAHNGGETTTDGFSFTVTDGTTTLPAAPFTITITPTNDPPTVQVNQGLTVQRGTTGQVTGALLAATDPDNTPAQLTYTVTAVPQLGTLRRDGVTLTAGGTFTQADVNTGLVTYVNGGAPDATDGFTFTVTDGTTPTAPATFTITVLAPPASQACTPRPRIQLQTTATPGQLVAIVEATPLGTNQNNFLREIRIDKADNATVRINGTSVTVGPAFIVPAGQVQVQLAIAKTVAAQPATVQLTVKDGCGDWKTFLGGGANAF